MATPKPAAPSTPKSDKPRKPRDDARRNALRTIREAAQAIVPAGFSYVGVRFGFSDTGQGTIYVYCASDANLQTVKLLSLTTPSLLKLAIVGKL